MIAAALDAEVEQYVSSLVDEVDEAERRLVASRTRVTRPPLCLAQDSRAKRSLPKALRLPRR